MLPLTILFVVLVIVGVIVFFIQTSLIFAFSRIFKVPSVSFKKTTLVSLWMLLISFLTVLLLRLIGLGIIAQFASIITVCSIFCYKYKKYYSISTARSLGIYITVLIVSILLGLIISLPVRMYLFEPFVVFGTSMAPNLNKDDYIFIEKISRNFKRNDIVVFNGGNNSYIKRIIGLPGDKIYLGMGFIKVNDQQINLTSSNGTLMIHGTLDNNTNINLKLGANEYFVLGDNLNESKVDSRFIGPIHSEDIVGRVIANLENMLK